MKGRTWLAGHGLQDMDCWIRIAGHGLQDMDTNMDCRKRITGQEYRHGSQDMDCRTWIAGYGLQDRDTDMDCRTLDSRGPAVHQAAEGQQHIAGSTSGSRGPPVHKVA